jgi:ubiquitin-protein ligase
MTDAAAKLLQQQFKSTYRKLFSSILCSPLIVLDGVHLLATELMTDPVEGFAPEIPDDSNLYNWRIYLEGPKDTIYEGGVFQLNMSFPRDYPMAPPELRFISDFWHPNGTSAPHHSQCSFLRAHLGGHLCLVFPDGKVCISILHPPGEDEMSGERPEERWLPTQSVATIMLSVVSMLNDPNFSSPANVDASVPLTPPAASARQLAAAAAGCSMSCSVQPQLAVAHA